MLTSLRLPADIVLALRSLRRTPGFTAVAATVLALGIGGSTAVFSVVDQVLLRPLPYAESGQLVRIYQTRSNAPDAGFSVTRPAFDAYRQMRSFEDVAAIAAFREIGGDLVGNEGVERIRRLPVSASYFDVLRARPVPGRGFLPEEEQIEEPRTIVISHELWQRRLGGRPDVVGTILRIDGEPFEVVGVAPPGFEDPIVGAIDLWMPTALNISANIPSNHFLTLIGRLRAGASLADATAELRHTDALLAQAYPQDADRPGLIVGLHEDIVRGASRMLYVLFGAVGLVLLIVCVNIANLLLARATAREREFAVRTALGSGRARIVRQLLYESLLLGVLGGIAGVLLAAFLTDAIVALGSASVPRLAETSFDARVLAFSAAVSIGTALLFGLLPALRFSRVAADSVLRSSTRSVTVDRARNRLRSTLVGAQVALAFVLLVGSAILMLSFHRLQRVELGIAADGALAFEVHLPPVRYDSVRRAIFHEELARRLGELPGVAAAGAVSRLPATGGYHSWGTMPGTGPLAGDDDAFWSTQVRVVSGDYFAALGIPLVSGRLFDARDDAASPARTVISRATAELAFPGVDPLGHTLYVLGRPWEVIGVVEDVAVNVEGAVAPTVYRAHRQFAGDRNWPLTQVVRSYADPLSLVPAIRAELAALDPELVLHRPEPLGDVIGQGIAQQRFATWLMTGFAALAVVLATLGLFGVITYLVRQRRREIGIRAALGARPAQIRRMVLGQGLAVALGGVAVGLAGALATSRVLRALVFETEPADPRVLAASAVVMAAAATLATYLPAREATRVDPNTVLNEE
jgi:putative ABC transport system permease protein